jgi:hypothetical protein
MRYGPSLIRHTMNATLLKALVALVPVCMLLAGSFVLFFKEKSVCSFLQVVGAGCLVLAVLTHVFEARHLFPWIGAMSTALVITWTS